MSSWHKKDWLKLAGLLGLGATGLGAAGIGPLAGWFGAGAGAASAGAGGIAAGEPLALGGTAGLGAPMTSMFGPSVKGAGLLASFTPELTSPLANIAADAITGTAPAMGIPAISDGAGLGGQGLLSGFGGKGFDKSLKGLQLANHFINGQRPQAPQPMMPRPQPTQAQMSNKELAELMKYIYGGTYV